MKILTLVLLYSLIPYAQAVTRHEVEKIEYEKAAKRYQDLENEYQSLLNAFGNFGLRRTNVLPNFCNGRLTLASGQPVSTAGTSGATTLYFTPYMGNLISIYDGANWKTYQFSEVSLTDATLVTGKTYDLFAYSNSGTVAIEFSTAWTTNSSRADALAIQDGVYVKNTDKTRRYLGTVYYNGSKLVDTTSSRRVFNYCNRRMQQLFAGTGQDSWSYAGAPWQWSFNSATSVNTLIGIADTLLHVRFSLIAGSAASQTDVSSGYGYASQTTNSVQLMGGGANPTVPAGVVGEYYGYPSTIGWYTLYPLETTTGTATTFYGDNGNAAGGGVNSYLEAWIED